MELAEPRGRSAALLEQVRGAAADLARSEELAREDIRLAAQARSQITEAGQAISQARGYSSMGFGDRHLGRRVAGRCRPSSSCKRQNYEQSIQLAGAGMQSARQIYYAAMQQALHAADDDGGRATAPERADGRSRRGTASASVPPRRRPRPPPSSTRPPPHPPSAPPRRLRRRASAPGPATRGREAGNLGLASGNGRVSSATISRPDVGYSSDRPSLHARSIMILGKIWNSIAAQFNKLANAIRGYDPIAEMQYEYDRSVEQIKEGREGLAQYRALVERVTRQVDESRKHVALLEAKVKAYLNAGDRDTAVRSSPSSSSGPRTTRPRTRSNWPSTSRPIKTTCSRSSTPSRSSTTSSTRSPSTTPS